MSTVTTIILCASVVDDAVAPRVNECIDALEYRGRFFNVETPGSGGWVLGAEVWVAAINGLCDENAFIARLAALPWEHPQDVQVLIQNEAEFKFRMLVDGIGARERRMALDAGLKLEVPDTDTGADGRGRIK